MIHVCALKVVDFELFYEWETGNKKQMTNFLQIVLLRTHLLDKESKFYI